MKKKVNGHKRTTASGRFTVMKEAHRTAAGGQVWHIITAGERRTIATSATSIRIMERAATKFDRALRRLADR